VYSYTSASLSQAVKDGAVTWDFTGKIQFYVYSNTFPQFNNNDAAPEYNGKYGRLLLEDTLKYEKWNGGDLSTAEIAANAVKTNDATKPRKNKSTFNSQPKFGTIPNDSIIQVKITHVTTVTYVPQSSGEQRTVTSTVENYTYFNANSSGQSEYEKWYKGDTAFIIQSNSTNPSARNVL
jgi:hypothetical protein